MFNEYSVQNSYQKVKKRIKLSVKLTRDLSKNGVIINANMITESE